MTRLSNKPSRFLLFCSKFFATDKRGIQIGLFRRLFLANWLFFSHTTIQIFGRFTILTIGSFWQGEWETKDKKKKKRQASTGKDKKSEEGTGGTSDWDDSAPPPPSGNNGGAGDGKEWKVCFSALLIVITIFSTDIYSFYSTFFCQWRFDIEIRMLIFVLKLNFTTIIRV